LVSNEAKLIEYFADSIVYNQRTVELEAVANRGENHRTRGFSRKERTAGLEALAGRRQANVVPLYSFAG
jgi:hypothetical protein